MEKGVFFPPFFCWSLLSDSQNGRRGELLRVRAKSTAEMVGVVFCVSTHKGNPPYNNPFTSWIHSLNQGDNPRRFHICPFLKFFVNFYSLDFLFSFFSSLFVRPARAAPTYWRPHLNFSGLLLGTIPIAPNSVFLIFKTPPLYINRGDKRTCVPFFFTFPPSPITFLHKRSANRHI